MNIVWVILFAVLGYKLVKELVILVRLAIDPDYMGPRGYRPWRLFRSTAAEDRFWRDVNDHLAIDSRQFTDPTNVWYRMRKCQVDDETLLRGDHDLRTGSYWDDPFERGMTWDQDDLGDRLRRDDN